MRIFFNISIWYPSIFHSIIQINLAYHILISDRIFWQQNIIIFMNEGERTLVNIVFNKTKKKSQDNQLMLSTYFCSTLDATNVN